MTYIDVINEQAAELTALLLQNLREALFSSRAYLRPSDLQQVADTQTRVFLAAIVRRDAEEAQRHGAYLCTVGVGEQVVLGLNRTLQRFGLQHLAGEALHDFLERADEHQRHVVEGYIAQSTAQILEEQERIRSALQQNLQRYTLQLETAAELARTAISTLELGSLLTSAVDLISARFGLDYVAIYLLDEDDRYAELRAATGMGGRIRQAARHKLRANSGNSVGKCLASRQHILLVLRNDEHSLPSASWLEDTRAEMVLPLITHGRVIGALSAQSTRPAAFSSQDVIGFQIMCDQLANAIENARLYADAQRRAEDLAQAYDQLKELETLKDQFMQNISHELRTPLTMIRGYAEFMLGGQLGDVDDSQRDALQVILRNSEALSEMVTDILAMLELSATKTALTALSMREAVQDSVIGFQIVAAANGIALDADLASGGGACLVMARPNHLRRIIDNLLGNALKFTPSGGQVHVRLWEREQRVYLEVSDTGIGIPVHFQERIFDRFFQVDSSQRRTRGGAGLGLALVRELVQSYGGSVSAVSAGIDLGSTFTVTLPRVTL